jgi:hypothetical protein
MSLRTVVLTVCLVAALSHAAHADSITLTFDERTFQPANGLSADGVTFDSSFYLYYNYSGLGVLTGLTIPHPYAPWNYPDGSRVSSSGHLELTFAEPTSTLGMDLTVWSFQGPWRGSILLFLFGPEGQSLGAFDLFEGNSPYVSTTRATFNHDGAPVSRARLSLGMYGSGHFEPSFDLDNLRYDAHPTPEPSTIVLLGTGLAGLVGYGLRRNRRGNKTRGRA